MRATVALLALFTLPAFGLDTSKLHPTGYVNDFAHVLDPQSAQALEAYCANLDRVTGVQMAIVLVDSLEDDPIEDVANRLYGQWGIGKKGKDEGILLLLAIRDRKQRAEVGYGLEPIVPDGFAGGILRGIRPILRQGNYGGALYAAAQQFGTQIAQSKGVDLGVGQPIPRGRRAPRGGFPVGLLVVGFFVLMWLIGKAGGGGRGGRRGGGMGTGLLTGMILGNMMGRRGGYGGGWGGGGFGGGGGGGGFGGFGGGSSGGGGASGGW